MNSKYQTFESSNCDRHNISDGSNFTSTNYGQFRLRIVSSYISIPSYNCNSLADYKKRRSVFTWLKEKEYNIYCLQETHSTSLDEVAWKREWCGEIVFCHGQRNSKDVMILINKNVDLNVQIVRNHSQGRWIFLNMKVDEKEIWLINLYGPNQDDPHFFENIYTDLLTMIISLC